MMGTDSLQSSGNGQVKLSDTLRLRRMQKRKKITRKQVYWGVGTGFGILVLLSCLLILGIGKKKIPKPANASLQKPLQKPKTSLQKPIEILQSISMKNTAHPSQQNNLLNSFLQRGNERVQALDLQEAICIFHQGCEVASTNHRQDALATFTTNLAILYCHTGRNDKGIELYEQAYLLWHELGIQQRENMVLWGLSIACINSNQYEKAVEKLEQLLPMVAGQKDRLREGEVFRNLALAYESLGNREIAMEYYQKAIAIFQQLGDKQNLADTINNLGTIQYTISDYSGAIQSHGRALQIHREIGDRRGEGNDLTNLASIYDDEGKYEKSLELFTDALHIHRELGNRQSEASILNNVSNMYRILGNHAAAIRCLEDSRKIHKELGNRQGEAAYLGGLGLIYQDLGDYHRAMDYTKQSADMFSQLNEYNYVAKACLNLGMLYAKLGDNETALVLYDKAIDSFNQTEDLNGIARCLTNLARLCNDMEEYTKAILFAKQAIKLYKELGIPGRSAEVTLGDIYLKAGYSEKAWDIIYTLDDASRRGHYYLIKKDFIQAKDNFVSYLSKSEIHVASRNAAVIGLGLAHEGLKEFEKAADCFRQACQFLERKRISLNESERFHFLAGLEEFFPRLTPYEGLVRVLPSTQEKTRGAFYYAENTRSRIFLETIATRYGQPESRISKELAESEKELERQIVITSRQMEAALGKDMARHTELEEKLKSLLQNQEKLIVDLRARYPEYAAVKYPQPMYIENIPLEQDEVLLEYEVTEPETRLFVVKEKKIVQVKTIAITRRELHRLVLQHQSFFHGIHTTSDLADYNPSVGKKLYDLLLKPVLEAKYKNGKMLIPRTSRIIIVPDEILGIMPFESLVISMPAKIKKADRAVPSRFKFVGDYYDIVYAQSATALAMQRNKIKGPAPRTLFVLADPIFSHADPRAEPFLPKRHEYEESMHKAFFGDKTVFSVATQKTEQNMYAEINRVEKTRVLAEHLTNEIFKGEQVQSLLDEKANEAEVKNHDMSQYKYVVFATHGMADLGILQEPALVLSQINTTENDNGFLTLSEVLSLQFQADIVALTACKTGIGNNVKGEGIMGLGRAFQYAGAKAVLVSLWSVAEDSSVFLTERFFVHLKQGESPRKAIYRARQDVRKEGYEHPFYWAPFILVGD